MFCSANLSIHHAVGVLTTGRRTARTSRVLQVSVVPWLCKVRVLWEEEHKGGRDIVKHIIKLKVTCTLKSALHSCRLSTRCQSGSGSPQALTKKENTSRDGGSTALYTIYTVYTVYTVYTAYTVYTVYTVYTIQTALHCLNSSMFAYIYCREGKNAIATG